MDKLKELFKAKVLSASDEIKGIIKDHGSQIIDHVQIDQIYGGMRGIQSMIWETSSLDAQVGIRFRGLSIPMLREQLPKLDGATEPQPEGLFWLMMTGEVPTDEEVQWLTEEWQRRSVVPDYVIIVINSLTPLTHPMTQLSIAILAMQSESVFAKSYEDGMKKSDYWEAMYEDSMNLIARLPIVAAYIYRKTFHNGNIILPDRTLDWSGNFAHMLGNDSPAFKDLMRLYLTIHADHEGGNASAHTVHLVGSTLSDPYYSLAAGMTALAGPLHGLANQEVMDWIYDMIKELGTNVPTKEQIADYVKKTLAKGIVVPGYGHAVLRAPDPRFIAQKEFATKHCPNDPMVNIVWNVFEVVPPILGTIGKIKNPWPNVDAHSGALLEHFGIKEHNFYTVLFGISRTLGVLAQLCWDRALNLPLERPKSLTTEEIKLFIKNSTN
ncbi:MAG: citrate (Si)-synthase, eukaryotic [Saprospiraceae bacterium]|jgi:citrate synthase|uniref:citrate synthase (unknown stereospecificity) n=1 Tax=Candidatus Defluviibacterium haderslevense TaxID=2981993 RepID=A0A9D7SBD9_9BACT|nr:citrate (Si)-synthase, eukaryotic [Candidatus Defluviibacterium haderslevense]MBL0235622.1 citrate (Si)-synthase, eukaryotic [Candidatus Defluviibacterium haderslevense]